MLLQIDRRDIRRNVCRRDDGLEPLELRYVDNRRLLFRLLLLLLIQEDHRRIERVVFLLFAGRERRDNGAEHDETVTHERYETETKRPFLIRLAIGLDQIVEHRVPPVLGGLAAK